MAKRELSKCRVWERERRDRLKSCFTALSKLLPSYDPSSVLSKIEILQRAAALISELQSKNKELLLGSVESTEAGLRTGDEIRRLHERVKKLLLRNEQLYNLLQTAGIRVPNECGTVAVFRQTKKWSSKISPEVADTIVKKLARSTPVTNILIQQPENIVKIKSILEAQNDTNHQKKKQKKQSSPKKKKKETSPSNENVNLNNKQRQQQKGAAVRTCKNVKKASEGGRMKAVSAMVGVPGTIYTSPALGPGTLILADGSVLPVVSAQPPPSRACAPATTAASTTAFILMPHTRGPRMLACRPAAGTKVAIPPLRSRQLPPPLHSVNKTVTVRRRLPPVAKLTRHKQRHCVHAAIKTPDQDHKNVEETTHSATVQINTESTVKKKSLATMKVPDENAINPVSITVANRTQTEQDTSTLTEPQPATASVKNACGSPSQSSDLIATVPPLVAEVNTQPAPEQSVASQNECVVSDAAEKKLVEVPNSKNQATVQTSLPAPPSVLTSAFPFGSSQDAAKDDEEVAAVSASSHDHHSELSNDIFASLSVSGSTGVHATAGHNPESMSPTAAFLLAFPLVSTLTGAGGAPAAAVPGNPGCRTGGPTSAEETSDSRQDTPTLLQIGTMESTPPTASAAVNTTAVADSAPGGGGGVSSGLLALDTFSSFFVSSSATATAPFFAPPTVTKAASAGEMKSPSNKQYLYTGYEDGNRSTKREVNNTLITCSKMANAPRTSQYNSQQQQQCNTFNPFSDTAHGHTEKQYSSPYAASIPTTISNTCYEYGFQHAGDCARSEVRPATQQHSTAFNYEHQQPQDQLLTAEKRVLSANNASTAGRVNPYEQQQTAADKRSTSISRPPVNWMTTPDTRHPGAGDLAAAFPTFEFGGVFGSGSANSHQWDVAGGGNNAAYRAGAAGCDEESNRWSWSPGKLLPPLLGQGADHGSGAAGVVVPTTLPTLVGDLALGTVASSTEDIRRATTREHSRARKTVQQQQHQQHYDIMQSGAAFSVSHLVEQQQQQKDEVRGPAAAGKRAHSSGGAKAAGPVSSARQTHAHTKRQGTAVLAPPKWPDGTQAGIKRYKQSSSSYSAEALIGGLHTDTNKQQYQLQQQYHGTIHHPQSQYQPVTSAPAQPYYQQQQHQSTAGGGDVSSYSVSFAYSGSTTMFHSGESSYAPQQHQATNSRPRQCHSKRHTGRVKSGANRHHIANETVPPPYMDLSFLSVPATIGSPLLPEAGEFAGGGSVGASTGGGPLPPPPPAAAALYYGRNYGTGSPTSGATPSLTNFNLSAIFPEIGVTGTAKTTYGGGKAPGQQLTPSAYVPASLPFVNS